MSLQDARAIKRAWMKETVSYRKLRVQYKLDREDILRMKSDVKYKQERYYLNDVKNFLDWKIRDTLNQQSTIPSSCKPHTKECEHCKKDVNADYFSVTKPTLCIPCERRKENKYNKKLEQIACSGLIKPQGNQMQML